MTLQVITYATLKSRVERLICLAECHGLNLKVVGLGERWTGLMNKPHTVWAEAKASHASHILFVDGYDSLILGGEAEIMERFEALHHPIVFSAEAACWPKPNLAPKYPRSYSPWHFLNSGGYMAERGALLELFANGNLGDRAMRSSDQLWFTEQFLAHPGIIKLDTECVLFQSLAFAPPDWFDLKDGFLNRKTGTHPLVLHANGGTSLLPYVKLFTEETRLKEEDSGGEAREG